MGKVKAAKELLETGIVSLVKRPTRQYARTEKHRLAQSLRAQAREKSTDTFKYQGKTYNKSEGIKAFYNTKKNKSGIAYKWTPKDVRGRGFGVKKGYTFPYLEKEGKLIKAKMQELDKETLKGMWGPDLVKYIKNELNLNRTAKTLHKIQQEVIGGGWKVGRGNRGAAGPDHFTYRGKVYPKSEGFIVESESGKRWRPKFEIVPKRMPGSSPINPVIAAERESIKNAFEKIPLEQLKKMTGPELLAVANKIPGINRVKIPYEIREEIIGGGWKPRVGKKPIEEGKLQSYVGMNSLSPKNFNKVVSFLEGITKKYPRMQSRQVLQPLVDRMVRFAKRKNIPEEQIVKKLYETDIEGIGDIIIKKSGLSKLWKEAKDLGLKPDFIDLSHIDAVERNWVKALDPSNLFFANEKSNRYLQKAIEEQIQILRKAIPQAKSLSDKKMIAQQKIVLDPKKRKEHMYKYYKPRTLKEMNEELAEADLVSEIGGTRRGAQIDPNDPYFAEKMGSKLRSEIAKRKEEINLQAAHTTLNKGGIVNGYAKGGYLKKLLEESIGMMSRRKFLKGTGATALSAALPKSALQLAPAVIKKGALNFAPPWVNGMLSALKDIPITANTVFKMGNNAKVQKIGSKKIKLYGGETGTESHYRVKTSDQAMADEMITKGMGKSDTKEFDQLEYWDDIVLTEEPGQTTISWKNKMYDEGNDQHIVIDKISKETRFVDDNWHMEAGGEDIAKDDWIEYIMHTDKGKLSREMGLAKGDEIGEKLVDEWSVSGMDNSYSGIFESFVDSFSPSGNIFGTVAKLKNALSKPSITKKYKKEIDKMQKTIDDHYEKEMMDWESQFRAGSIHGYYRGGTSMRDYPQQNKIAPKRKPPMRRPDNWNMENVLDSMAFVESSNRPDVKGSRIVRSSEGDHRKQKVERAHGMYQILPSTARQPGFGITPWSNFSNEWNDPTKSRDFAKRYLQGLVDYYEGDWFKAISQYGGDSGVNYWNKIVSNYNKGGIARRPNAVPPTEGPDPYATFINDSVSQIRSSPSEFMGSQFIQKFSKGGFVKRNAPKVIGKLTNYKPKLTMSDVLKNIQKAKKTPPANPYAAFNKEGLVLKDFKTKAAGDKWVKETHKKKVAEGDTTTDWIYEVKKKPSGISVQKAEEPGALFWGSREKIIGAPSEAMTGTQWLQYMKIGKHGILNPKGYPRIKDMELNDTSLAPWLSRQGNKTVSKDVLVKQFDEMAPTMDVVALGEARGGRIFDDMSRSLAQIDTQAIRNPAIKGFYDYIKAVLPQLKSSQTSKEAKEIAAHINAMVERNFGVANALEAGVPQRFPFEIKEILQQISTGLGKRTAGFKTYTRDPQHRGTQMMGGGDNYREFLFKYKPGSLRQTEPGYKYAHDFNLGDSERMGGVVHARTTDRADQFGRRLLHIEEIQSDMHQKVNAAQRLVKRKIAEGKKPTASELKAAKYAPRGDLKEEVSTANEQHLLLVKSKLEDLLAQKQTAAIKTRIARLNKERIKVRKIIQEEQKKMAAGDHSGVPQGPLSKTEDYNEFIMKYFLKVAREGGYDGITINTAAIKNRGMSPTGKDYKGNLIAYGPMARGAMEKAAKKSGAKFMKTYIMDDNKRAWEVPMILIKENKAAQAIIDKGLPIYKKGGIVKK